MYILLLVVVLKKKIVNDSGCRNRKNGVPAVDHHEVFQQFQKAKDSDQVGNQINSGKK